MKHIFQRYYVFYMCKHVKEFWWMVPVLDTSLSYTGNAVKFNVHLQLVHTRPDDVDFKMSNSCE